jgi:phospholipid/cholesterol/gamma-HCH transport system substrate-binding protein
MRRAGQSRFSDFTVGAAALVILALLTYLGFTKALPFQHHFQIKAVFRSSNNLRTNSPVRIAGVNVGKVTGTHPLHGDGDVTVVTMRVDKRGLPIHKDAHFAIRPRIFLEGNFFVDVQPGTPEAPALGDGDTAPATQTSTPVQVDQVLTALQSDTRHKLQALLREYGRGLSGRGARGFNRSIPHWAPAYASSSVVNDALQGQRPHDLSAYLRSAGTVAAALDRRPSRLRHLIADLDTTALAFARSRDALEQTVAELPRTLRAAEPALVHLDASFPPLRALGGDLRPAVRSAGPALDAALPFVRQARRLVSRAELRGLVGDLRPTVPALARLNAESSGLLDQTRLASSCQNEVILPWSRLTLPDHQFPAKGPVFQEAARFLTGLAGESRSGDANGQWFSALGSNGTLTYALGSGFGQTTFPLLGTQPPPSPRPPNRETVPCETQQVPDLRVNPGPPPQRVRTDATSPRARSRYRLAYARATEFLREGLLREGFVQRAAQVAAQVRADVRNLSAAQLRVLERDMARAGLPRRERLGLP